MSRINRQQWSSGGWYLLKLTWPLMNPFRYTCPRPCLGTDTIPGRNGHITSFITRYGEKKSQFHGYPLLGGTKTAMRSFFNFTDTEPIRNVELALSAVPWGAVSMMKIVTEKSGTSETKANYVGFIKWLNTGFVSLENPSGMCLLVLICEACLNLGQTLAKTC